MDPSNQEMNFLKISFYTKENKTLIQGPHDNLMSFVNNHLNLEKSATHDISSSDPNNMVINQTDNNIGNYETESELSAISSVNEEEYKSLVQSCINDTLGNYEAQLKDQLNNLKSGILKDLTQSSRDQQEAIKELYQGIMDKDQEIRDLEIRFNNRLKQQEQDFNCKIEEITEKYQRSFSKLSIESDKLANEVNSLKQQLKAANSEIKNLENAIAFTENDKEVIPSPIPLHLKTPQPHPYPTTNRYSVLSDTQDHLLDSIPTQSEKHTNQNALPQLLENTSEPNEQPPSNTEINNYKEKKGNQSEINKSMSLSDGPILILSDSMLKGIKEIKLSNETYINKQCITGAKIEDLQDLISKMKDTVAYSQIVIHVGTNNIFKTNETDIIDEIETLLESIKQKWPNANVIFSSIILHKTDSRKNAIINRINQEIKHLSNRLSFRFMDNTNVVTLPTGNIDNDAYFDNLHLNNQKGSRKLANNLKIYLCLKSPRKTRPQEPKQPTQLQQPQQQGNIWKKEPFPSYANIVKSERPMQNNTSHQIQAQSQYNRPWQSSIPHYVSHPQPQNYQINQPQPQLQQQLPPQNLVKNNPAALTTDQLLDAMRPIAELFNFFRITER